MTYGTIKVDTVTFTDAGVDKSVTLSGLVQNPTFSGNVTVTGTLSGVTVTGTTANFTSGNFTNISGGTHTITSGVFAAGSAASPSITFTGDLNTGIYSPGADQVAISTGGTGRLFVGSTGTSALSLNTAAGVPVAISSSTDGEQFRIRRIGGTYNPGLLVGLSDTASNEIIFNSTYSAGTAPSYVWQDAGNERMRLTGSGRLGIGTSSPVAPLHVSGSGVFARLTDTQAYSFGTSGPILDFTGNDSSGASILFARLQGSPSNGNPDRGFLNILTRVNGVNTSTLQVGTGLAADVFVPNGRLGIGATPLAKFHVNLGTNENIHFATGGSGDQRIQALNDAGGTSVQLSIQASPLLFRGAGGSEVGRWDTSGRLLVGTSTSPSNAQGSLSKLIVQGYVGADTEVGILSIQRGEAATSITVDEAIGQLAFNSSDGGTFAHIQASADATAGNNDYPGRLVFSTTADGASSPTERMRIDSAGALKTSTNGTYKFGTGIQELTHNDTTSTIHLAGSNTSFAGDLVTFSTYRNTVNDTYKFLSCTRQGFAVALEIRDDGDVYNVNGTYGSLSDVKLKENIVDARSQWDDIKQLRVRNYNFKPETNNSTHKQIGVIAQELETVSPGLVNTVSDRDADGNDLGTVTKSVNYSVLYMKAVKALQEAMERIETLEAKVAALEGV